jgi:nitrogen-specific signal transduction histidine kinase/CheY-like chemotaxis protein
VTQRQQAEHALDQAREQLAQSQKMEALGQLTGGIAHDFNNLLMIVSGHAQSLRRRLKEPKDVRAVDAIASAAGRGEGLTRRLLAFSRRQQLNPVVIDLRARLEAMRALLASSLCENIELAYDIPEGLWPVEVDPGELERALLNIAVNARDAMPDAGNVLLSARNVTLRAGAEAGPLAGDFVRLSLADSGIGIAPETQPKVFEPFFTTKPVGKGTGLGLSQVHGFAHQSGGTVTIDSQLGRGTTVAIFLPRSRRPLPPTPPAPADSAPRRDRGKVLIVEDNAEVAEATATMFEHLGYQAMHAFDADEGLARLRAAPGIELVLTDVVMPGGKNGIALAQEITRLFPSIPVVLTSGYSDAVNAAQTQFPLLRKPFDLNKLERAIGEALGRRDTRQSEES